MKAILILDIIIMTIAPIFLALVKKEVGNPTSFT